MIALILVITGYIITAGAIAAFGGALISSVERIFDR